MSGRTYTVECPFCEADMEKTAEPEYPYTSAGCSCGARFKFDHRDRGIQSIETVPSVDHRITLSEDTTIPADEYAADEAMAAYRDRLETRAMDGSLGECVSIRPGVATERVGAVLYAGIHGDAEYGVSSKHFRADELEQYGIDVTDPAIDPTDDNRGAHR